MVKFHFHGERRFCFVRSQIIINFLSVSDQFSLITKCISKSFFKRQFIAMNSNYFVLVNSYGFVFFIHWRMQDLLDFVGLGIWGLHPGALHPSFHTASFWWALGLETCAVSFIYFNNKKILSGTNIIIPMNVLCKPILSLNYLWNEWTRNEVECTANSVFIVDFHMITSLLRKSSSVPGEAFTDEESHVMSELTEEIISILHFL